MDRLLNRRLMLAGAVVALSLVVAGCAGSSSAPLSEAGSGGAVGAPTVDESTVGRDAGGALPQAPADSDSNPGGNGADPLAIGLAPMVVRTGSMELEVSDLDAALLRARAAIIGLGGYISDSQRTNGDGHALATITYRIPADRWDDALDALSGLAARVVTERTQALEVTAQAVDLDARITNLRATEVALQGIMAKATRISDILEVQNQLTAVQGQIEQLVAQRNHLADQATYGTLAVTWTVPLVAVVEATEGWNLGAELDRAFAQLLQVGQGLLVIGIWLAVVVLPIVAGLALAVALVLALVRRLGLTGRQAAPASAAGPTVAS